MEEARLGGFLDLERCPHGFVQVPIRCLDEQGQLLVVLLTQGRILVVLHQVGHLALAVQQGGGVHLRGRTEEGEKDKEEEDKDK